MYCKFCGRQTVNTDGVCDECRKNEVSDNNGNALYDRTYGYNDALFSTVYGCITAVLVMIGMILSCVPFIAVSVAGLIVSLLFGLGSLIALPKGISSIKRFIEAKRHGVKPIATLVLGIVGTVACGVAVFFALLGTILPIIALAACAGLL